MYEIQSSKTIQQKNRPKGINVLLTKEIKMAEAYKRCLTSSIKEMHFKAITCFTSQAIMKETEGIQLETEETGTSAGGWIQHSTFQDSMTVLGEASLFRISPTETCSHVCTCTNIYEVVQYSIACIKTEKETT